MPGAFDVFYRRWMKALSEDIDDPRLYRLSLDCRGVFALACLYSLRSSRTPGRFESQAYDGPMTLEDIAEGIHVDMATVESAFGRLLRTAPPLLSFEHDTWSIVDWEKRSHQGEIGKIRAANAKRQATYRKRHSRASKRKATGEPTPLHEVGR
ncbi:MAG: hypothetical protein M3P30_11570 [Chloroflexota bacterium]|nr:hypothetical protein [Chloroflexota bacterium]